MVYRGVVDPDTGEHVVEVLAGAGTPAALPWRLDVRNHSPTGLSWGYAGSGPAQCALAILCHAVGAERAVPLYQEFKRDVIGGLPQGEGWEMPRAAVLAWAASREVVPRPSD